EHQAALRNASQELTAVRSKMLLSQESERQRQVAQLADVEEWEQKLEKLRREQAEARAELQRSHTEEVRALQVSHAGAVPAAERGPQQARQRTEEANAELQEQPQRAEETNAELQAQRRSSAAQLADVEEWEQKLEKLRREHGEARSELQRSHTEEIRALQVSQAEAVAAAERAPQEELQRARETNAELQAQLRTAQETHSSQERSLEAQRRQLEEQRRELASFRNMVGDFLQSPGADAERKKQLK